MTRVLQFDCPYCDRFFTDKPHLKFHCQEEHSSPGITASNSNTATVTRVTSTSGKISKESIEALLPAMQKSIEARSAGDIKALGLWVRETIKVLAENNKPFKNCSCSREEKESCNHQWIAASKGIDANATQFNSLFVAQWGTVIPSGKTADESKLLQIAYIRALTSYLQDQKVIAVVPKSFQTRNGTRGSVWYYCNEDKPNSYQTRSTSETESLLDKIAQRVKAASESAS